VALMRDGRVMFSGTPQDIKTRVAGTLIEVGVADQRSAAEALRALPFVTSVELYGDELQVLVSCGAECVDEVRGALVASGEEPRFVRPGRVSMEVAFSQLEAGT
jgi:hypothetical protein